MSGFSERHSKEYLILEIFKVYVEFSFLRVMLRLLLR